MGGAAACMNGAADAREERDALRFGAYQLWSQKIAPDTKKVLITNLHSGSWVVQFFFKSCL